MEGSGGSAAKGALTTSVWIFDVNTMESSTVLLATRNFLLMRSPSTEMNEVATAAQTIKQCDESTATSEMSPEEHNPILIIRTSSRCVT